VPSLEGVVAGTVVVISSPWLDRALAERHDFIVWWVMGSFPAVHREQEGVVESDLTAATQQPLVGDVAGVVAIGISMPACFNQRRLDALG